MAGLDSLARATPSPPLPPYGETPPPAARRSEVMRQDEQAERYHPETEDGQKTEDAAQDQQRTDPDSQETRLRQRDTAAKEVNPAAWHDAFVSRS